MTWTAEKTWAVGDIFTSSDANVYLKGALDWLRGDTAWITPSFQNGWSSAGGNWSKVGYRRVGDQVFLRGDVVGGTWGQPMFTVPAAYCGVYDVFACVISNETIAYCTVRGTNVPAFQGQVTVGTAVGGSNAYVFLDQVRWFIT